jgi:hypothetical protein
MDCFFLFFLKEKGGIVEGERGLRISFSVVDVEGERTQVSYTLGYNKL